MKKTFLVLALLAGLYSQANAQQQLKFSVKAGLTAPKFVTGGGNTDIKSSKTSSFYAGASVDIPLNTTLSIQPGLTFIGKGFREYFADVDFVEGQLFLLTVERNTKPYYIELPFPLVAGFNLIGGKLQLGAGPYAALGVGGRHKTKVNAVMESRIGDEGFEFYEDEKIKFGSSEEDVTPRADFGLSTFVAFQLRSGIGLQGGFSRGLTRVNNNDPNNVKIYNQVLSLGLFYTL
ncbi:outer membrane beta-barrel protein [Pedobacter deserti]|uniref:outer membrane beta-barrel protein n=1 Tax=Pedobacter deserti TaxID=2817382 RepID=UPI00210EBF55|nr:outer membrane beta-barrel protein [Pedobacter sp. SYSU D00382]